MVGYVSFAWGEKSNKTESSPPGDSLRYPYPFRDTTRYRSPERGAYYPVAGFFSAMPHTGFRQLPLFYQFQANSGIIGLPFVVFVVGYKGKNENETER